MIKNFLKIFMIAILFINGCGYTLHTKSDLPFQEIYLRKVENQTLEPGLQDRMRKIAYQKLVENGFTLTSSAEKVLDIQITNYRLSTLSEVGLTTVEYQILLNIKATLYDSNGSKLKEFQPAAPFTTYFRVTRDLQSIIANRNLAIESLMNDICDDLMRKLIFQDF
ncbi:LPS assembly lipoprotein LptE [Thermodesulfovibrio hydrogeniphilus]